MGMRADKPAQDFPIVALGASAGGLEALQEFFRACPPSPGAAFVVVVHLASDFKSRMPEILSRSTGMPVDEARDGDEVRVDRVYVIPPGKDMTIKGGILRLAEREPKSLTIDVFLESLAADQGKRAVAVILSGDLADGSAGVRAVKDRGGLVFAQDSRSAQHAHMPEAAAATGAADGVMAPGEIARRLRKVFKPAPRARRPSKGALSQDAALAAVCAYLREALKVDFTDYKKPTLTRRVRRRIAALELPGMTEYVAYLKSHPGEAQLLSDELLVHVTGFFRDPSAFETLKAKVYPELLERRSPQEPLRLWIAACSTGEEAYSHAMNLLEYLEERKSPVPIKIFATDLDEGVLAKARSGFFSTKAAARLSPARLSRFFKPVKGGYRIVKSVRDLCVFARHDVTLDAPFSKVDFISCRNLLIYLEPVLQKRVLPLFHYALNPNGFLMLGSSEAVAEAPGKFNVVDKKARLFSKIASASERPPEFTISREGIQWPTLPERRSPPSGQEGAGPDFQAEVSRILLNQYTPAGVLVDDALNIVQTHGSTSRFLELPSGVVSTNLAKMAHADLSLAIQAAVLRAKTADAPVKKRVRAEIQGEALDVQLDVIPVKTPLDRRRRYLVLFSPQPAPAGAAAGAPGKEAARQLEFQQLREELDSAKEYVRWVSREQETADLERRTASDETASTVEEFHSLNEELEAAKEELQAANEELTTANEDLSRRNAELRAANEEFTDLLGSAQVPMMLLDKEMVVRLFTPSAQAAFDLRPGDAGKPLTSLPIAIRPPGLEHEIEKVLRGRPAADLEVRDREGRWFTLRIRPYETGERTLDGACLTLLEITGQRKQLLELRAECGGAETALDAFKISLAALDSSLRIVRANKLFYESFRTSAAKACGRTLFQLGKGMWNSRPLKEKLHDLSQDSTIFTDFECEFEMPARGTRTLAISGRVLPHAADGERHLLIAIEDVTALKQSAEAAALRKSETRQRDFVANVSHELMTPITAIKGYSEALVAGALEIPGKRLKFTQIIEKHADRLTQLVEDLLQLSTSEAGQKKAVDVVPLAAQLQKLLMGLAPVARKRGISIRVKVAPDLKVHVNKSELNQVLQNLIANAVKYNRSKGRISIAASVVGKRILVSVSDTGIGVPKEDLTRIFDRFHRAANARSLTERGSGLGLSIVKSILAAHGCRIWAESVPGQGTTFFFTLPKA